MKHRHKSKTALICFLLCIPMAFIAYFAIIYSNEGVTEDNVRKVELTFPNGNTVVFDDMDSVSFYVNALLNASKLTLPVTDPDKVHPVSISFVKDNGVKSYSLYAELSATGCMFGDADGGYCLIGENAAKALLSRQEFSYLYSEFFMPEMYVVSGNMRSAVKPVEYEWGYKKIDGSYTNYNEGETKPKEERYTVYSDRENIIEFSRKPDSTSITITDQNGALIGQSDIGSMIFGKDTLLRVSLTALWRQTGDSRCHGEAEYSFFLLYDIPAQVSFLQTTAEIGGYIRIDARHLNDDEDVVLRTALKVGKLYFTENEGVKTAILAVSDENIPGEYDIEYTVGDNHGTSRLSVTGQPREDRGEITRLNVSAENFELRLGNDAMAALSDIIDNVYSNLGGLTYSLLDSFSPPTPNGSVTTSFGGRVIVNIDNTTDTAVFYSDGYDYDVIENSRVSAAGSGVVVYTGFSPTLGNFIVIDHGNGVCSWYCGLSALERDVGDKINKGGGLGFAGVSPYTLRPSLRFMISAGGLFIKPPFN